ncbi:MAG: glycosyltransferase [Candidatus Palauibacterales bacterium]|nr:glycosyltransferase [Candidatus Palauibacterales bacterium]
MARVKGRRIVLATLGSYGDVNPYLGLAVELAARGHEPVLATSAYYRDYVESQGVGFRPIRPDVDPGDTVLVRRILDRWRGTERLVRELLMPSLRASYEDLSSAAEGADLLVTHPITFSGPIVAEERGLAWVSTVLSPISLFSEHDLPVFPPAPWMKRLERLPGAARAIVALARRATREWTEPVARLREERGLPPGGNPLFEGQHSPDCALALFSRLLARPQPDWPEHVRVMGHVFYDRAPDGGSGVAGGRRGLADFLDRGPAPVVFTLGSSAVAAAGDFYEESLDAARRIGVRAVLLTGPRPENRPAQPLPDGVRVADYASYAELFPRSAAVVHQGGIGTLAQALRAGVPMLVVPFAHDQPDNAHRAERLGVARVLAPRRYRGATAGRELRALLGAPSLRERAAEVGRVVRAEDGLRRACDAIEERLESAGRR